jgi:peptidyl-prolyl cis-trans isomerase A (cyclophilin A)
VACTGDAGSGGGRTATLEKPDPASLAATAPDSFTVTLQTSKGEIDLLVRRALAPRGADRLHWLATHGFFDGGRFFRVVPGFVVQFGLTGVPSVDKAWEDRSIPDDSVRTSNRRGTIVFATAGPDTRTTQLFINLADNLQLDAAGFAPVGEVRRGMDIVDQLHSAYGDGPPMGTGPDQLRIMREGNAYLLRRFPQLDSIIATRVAP